MTGETTFAKIASVEADTRLPSDKDVGLGLTYDYRVRAFGLAGFSAHSNVASATSPSIPPDQTPPVVTIVQPADGSTVSGNVKITASAIDNIGVYVLEVRTIVSSNPQVICGKYNVSDLTCTWRTGSLAPGTYALYGVRGGCHG